jgi:TolA-binding protein
VHLFPGTEGAQKAALRLKELREDQELRQRLDAFIAAKLLRAAEEAMDRRQYATASEAVDSLLERYPASEHATAAKAVRTKLDSSPEIARVLNEQRVAPEARRLLRTAEGYARNRMTEKALAMYEKVATQFPDTSFAETARKRIRELGGKP